MTATKANISSKAATWVENHTWASLLLAVLCLSLALNLYFFGPGSDGGSGLGGTGFQGGESGLGGTGKSPDSGPSFKLGANSQDDNRLDEEGSITNITDMVAENTSVKPVAPEAPYTGFDVTQLRLNAEVAMPQMADAQIDSVNSLVAAIELGAASRTDIAVALTLPVPEEGLISSSEILESLMLAEAETRLAAVAGTDSVQRSRVAIPVRPERPDRLNMPTRIAPVSRASIPAPPPVRPMRTLSSLLNR